MKRMMKALTINGVVAAALVAGSAQAALAAPPTNVTVTVTPQNSTGGVIPTLNGQNYFYDYEIAAGLQIEDSLPIQICAAITQAGDGLGFPFDIKFGPNGAGGNLPGVTKPATITFNLAGCQTVYIAIDTDALAAGNYNEHITIADDDAPSRTTVNVDNKNVHIRAKLTAAKATTCFFTDSEFEFLLDCAGNMVTTGTDGRFSIVTNKKGIQVATNPGQFYYNILWTNTTGEDRTIKVNMARAGVRPQGAQAIHAKVFPSFPVVDATAFAAVNDAIPSGADDNLENVVVPNGWTVWVSYHVEWATLGSLISATSATTCSEANQTFAVLGTVREAVTNTPLGSCSAGAAGYRK